MVVDDVCGDGAAEAAVAVGEVAADGSVDAEADGEVERILRACDNGGVPEATAARARAPGPARRPMRALHLFSGPQQRPDGLAARLRERGWHVDEVDVRYGDSAREDVLDDAVFGDLLERAEAGYYQLVIAGIPCNTFSVARLKGGTGPPAVRRRTTGEARGLRDPPTGHEHEADLANCLVARACRLCEAAWAAGGDYIIENPIDRSCPELSARLQLGRWPKHVSLWQMEELRALRRRTGGRYVSFPQCALGGPAQKWTTLLFSGGLGALCWLGLLRCTHSRGQHKRRGIGRDASGAWASAALAAYPAEMNVAIAEVAAALEDAAPSVAVEAAAGALRPGSARPPACEEEAEAALARPSEATASSLRRNEPELMDVLMDEPLAAVNVPPRTDWFEVEEDQGVPGPLTTDELIPADVQRRVRAYVARVRACYARARRGAFGWRAARDARPKPLELSEEEAVLPAGRGWSWQQGSDGLWRPLTRSRWPEDPPESDLDVAEILRMAGADPDHFREEDILFADRYVLACMAHGHPAPQLVRAVVLGYPHVGALKSMEALDKCVAKDRKQEGVTGALPWTVHGGEFPQVWPVRADPINVAWNKGKPRMTIDKTMGLSDIFLSYNAAVDLREFDPVEMVRIEQLCRAAAVFRTAGVGVRVWSFDLEAYFRKIPKQRADWWKSGYLLPDGAGFDKRIQFGQKEAPVLTSRQSNFLVWAIRRELHAFDTAHPPVAPELLAWRLLRSLLVRTAPESDAECTLTALYFVMQFVDDLGAASPDDLLYTRDGSPVFARWCADTDRYVACLADAVGAVHLRRPDAHYAVALRTIERAGHVAAAGKGVPPCERMDLLGAHIDLPGDRRMLTEYKCTTYGGAIRELLAASPIAGGALRVPYAAFNSVVHKLLHAAATVVLGRQHLHHCMAARKASNRLAGSYALLHEPQVAELRWWLLQLETPERHCLPLASRVVFPDVEDSGVLCCYSDAARELASPEVSGYGAWCVVRGTFCWLAGLWTEVELRAFSINTLELAAENMGTFAFLAHARSLGVEVAHSVDFVDNTAAEYSADRGRPGAPALQELVKRRFSALDDLGVYSSVVRITSVDNDWADALSRGPARVADVLRMARALGMPTLELKPAPAWRELSGLPRLDD